MMLRNNLSFFVEGRVGYYIRYTIDATKIEEVLGWKAEESIEWYLERCND